MLRKRDVTVGKCYVNNARNIAREVLSTNHEAVRFNNYHLGTGNSCGSASECTQAEFLRWADREATPAEIANLQTQEMDALFRAPNHEALDRNLELDPAAIALLQKTTLNR